MYLHSYPKKFQQNHKLEFIIESTLLNFSDIKMSLRLLTVHSLYEIVQVMFRWLSQFCWTRTTCTGRNNGQILGHGRKINGTCHSPTATSTTAKAKIPASSVTNVYIFKVS